MKILLTGVAGFIGAALAQRLLDDGHSVLGIDNLNNYYDVRLKQARLDQLLKRNRFAFKVLDIVDRRAMSGLFAEGGIDVVVHMAAQAGVRYSTENPYAYIDSNLQGFANVLEGSRRGQVKHLVFASSSSVYGANTKFPFSENDNVDHPVSLYAATKKANELMAHSYSHLYGLPCTGLRFFTVYGPWGRPDMALFKFTKAILEGEAVTLFNRGEMVRDFTYVADIIDGALGAIYLTARPDSSWNSEKPNPSTSYAPYRIYNIGNSRPEKLMRYIDVLEKCLGKKAKVHLLPMQPGDVVKTAADVSTLAAATGFCPRTTIEEGIQAFVQWYKSYYQV